MQPFEVLCTNSDWEHEQKWRRILEWFTGKKPDPVDGGYYTVIEIVDHLYYRLLEFPDETYRKESFIPLFKIEHENKVEEQLKDILP